MQCVQSIVRSMKLLALDSALTPISRSAVPGVTMARLWGGNGVVLVAVVAVDGASSG
jgi:hypothetical protein